MREEASTSVRSELTPEQRTADLRLMIDPGFVHHSKIQTLVGTAMTHVDEAIRQLPDLPDWQRQVRVDHIYTEALLVLCRAVGAHTLPSLLAAGRGHLFCSTVAVEAAPEIYDDAATRVVSKVVVPGVDDYEVELHYSKRHIAGDTMRSQLYSGDEHIAVVAQFHARRGHKLIFHPLLMGSPWLSEGAGPAPFPALEWYSYDFFEHFIEDIVEFSRVADVAEPQDISVMEKITETAFKTCLAEILGEAAGKDWGGEMSDHYSAHVRLGERRTTVAFLLKGPAGGGRFRPMTLNHLGKNNDQIYRLSQEPAGLLVVQHCHEIGSAVRATLRAFAVQPGNPRRYCLIDGKDSLRLLMAYGKLDRALELSSGDGNGNR